MKYFILALSLLVNGILIYVLDTRKVLPLPLGRFLSAQEGIWQNAEPIDQNFNADLKLEGLQGEVDVYFDERLVPHVFAAVESDAYFVQGYLHAKFRLWQMEFQTHAAAGRISEIVGSKGVQFDRNQRRIGMVYAAENALSAMEKDPQTLTALNAYTAGINSFIEKLNTSELPIEYKLLGYEPEKWNNLKSALFIKQMTNTLAGYDRDLEYTNALEILGEEKFRILYSDIPDSLYPVIPKGTNYAQSTVELSVPGSADSLYFKRKDTIQFVEDYKPDPANGSNNWVVSGSKTKSGKPILANDPHLSLTLPSIWYEIQLTTPTFNSYGVSFPGIPGVVIGYNDSIAFGFTNAGRDVKDYYEIQFKDKSKQEYFFDSQWVKSTLRIENIKIKDSVTMLDTVAYTVFGPVTYDHAFQTSLSDEKAYALRWVAHDTSNILKMWMLLNRAKNYNDYYQAISHFNVPGQNMIFASTTGDIALWQQGTFPLRWKDQGLFVMPGRDSSYMWKGYIPMDENPHSYNPESGFLSSANQRAADTSYPYFMPGSYEVYRPITINRKLAELQNITVMDMKNLQNNNYNVFAEMAIPILLQHTDRLKLSTDENRFLDIVSSWNLFNDTKEKGPTGFTIWWDSLSAVILNDDLIRNKIPVIKPEKFVLLEALSKDTNFIFIDDVSTDQLETLNDQVTIALKKASLKFSELEKENKVEWSVFKNTSVYHLLRANTMPFAREGLNIGGGSGIVNATTHDHGPSWKMIIEMDTPVKAVGVYPGGQSGNPGSQYYDSFIDTWAKGEYYDLKMMTQSDIQKNNYKWKMKFSAK
ncbi:MAG: penicillin acylase family protein [Chitinophagaceae bacterium]